jgi:hypothetical protein
MKTKLLVGMLLAASSVFAGTHVSIGIGVGGYGYGYVPPPPPPVVEYAPSCPGPGYTWVDGYWYDVGPRRNWHAGYWAPPVYGYGWRERHYEGDHYYRHYGREYDRHEYHRHGHERHKHERD